MNTTQRIAVGLLIILVGIAVLSRQLDISDENTLMVGSIVSLVLIGGVGYSLYYWRERVRREVLVAGLVLMAGLAYAAALLFSRWFDASPLGASAGLVVLIGVVIYVIYSFLRTQARANALRPVARQLGFTFYPGERPDPPDFPVLPAGRMGILANVMQGSYGSARVTIFDHQYRSGSHRTGTTHRQTMIGFEATGVDLPRFALRTRRGWGHRSAPFRRPPHEIVLENAPAFSKHYRLWGESPHPVRALFNSRVLEALHDCPGFEVEATPALCLVYRPRKRIRAGQLQDALEGANRLFSLFHAAARDTEQASPETTGVGPSSG